MADYSASLKGDDDDRRRGSSPSLLPHYIISFIILTGAVIAFIEMGNNLSNKTGTINTLNQTLSTLQEQFNTLSQQVSYAQGNLTNANTSLTNAINNLTGSVNSSNAQVQNLSSQVSSFSNNITTISNNVQTLSSSVSTLNNTLTPLPGQVNGLLTPVNIPLTITPINAINATTTTNVTTGTPFATANLSNINGNSYLSCSAAVVFTSSVDGPTFNLGYTLGGGSFNSAFISVVSNSTNNVGFAVVNIQVGASNNNQTLSFQYAFTDSTSTTLNVTNVATSASCSWFA